MIIMTNDDLKVLKRQTAIVLFVDIIFILAAIGIFGFTSITPIAFKIGFGVIYVILGLVCMWAPNKNVIGGWKNYKKNK